MFISIQKYKSLTVVPATLEKQFYFPFKELLPSILIEVSRRIVGSVGSGRCWFVYQIYPPTIDTLVTGMDKGTNDNGRDHILHLRSGHF